MTDSSPGEGRHLSQRFVVMCFETWQKYGQSSEDLQRAMLSASINAMLEESGHAEVAEFLHALAVQINPPRTAGHA